MHKNINEKINVCTLLREGNLIVLSLEMWQAIHSTKYALIYLTSSLKNATNAR